jgi:ATP-dependent Clp protease ATP-binding subunit ClpA
VIDEPSIQETVKILEGLRTRYEGHHRVQYTSDALEAAAKLAARHLRDYKLPDSAIDVLDEAGAKSRLKRSVTPAASPLTEPPPAVEINAAIIEEVVARMARIPAKQASSSDRDRLRALEESLGRVVFGQEEAVGTVARAIKRARAGLGQPDRPAGCFLFTGPTGVGKTELAKQLALHLGNEFIRFDMSEYMEKHAVARLIGAPPGYVGFEQGGLLVDSVRQHPYAVLLLDEIEKAHTDIFNILLQVMDHATLTDNNGRKADFRQVVLIMTSNAGSRELSTGSIGFAEMGTSENVQGARQKAAHQRSKQAIERVFSPEFRNRLDAIVSFGPLTPAVMETIVEKFILQLEAQLAERRVAITLEPEARAWLAEKGFDPVFGARPLARVIQTHVRDPLTDEILFGRLESGGTVTIVLKDGKLDFTFEETAPPPKTPAPVA